jgi:hypothetical protein
MDLFTINSWIILGVIFAIGSGIGMILQITWIMRILIASYIALCLVLVIPNDLLFSEYAQIIYFIAIITVFTAVENSRFFDVANWTAGRFSFESISLSILTVLFMASIICTFTPFGILDFILTKELYNFFVEYIFYFAIAPLIFTIIFSKRLHY